MAEPSPGVSITVAAWNGMRWLPGLLDSVAAQAFSDYELIIVDDASTDDSLRYLRDRLRSDGRARILTSESNRGYVHAQNRAIKLARGKAILVLNQDVVLDERFLGHAMRTLDEYPTAGAIQGRVLRLRPNGARTDTVDTTGLVMHRDRRITSRGQRGVIAAADLAPGIVWGADGPAALYRRAALLDVRQPDLAGGWEILDSDFGMQKEDADLAWRLRRSGWETRFEPGALAWHARSGGDSAGLGLRDQLRANMSNPPETRVQAWRNQRLMQLKNDEPGAVMRDLPWIVRREASMLTWMVVRDRERLRAVLEFLRLAPRAIRRRRSIGRAARARRGPT